MKKKLIRKRRNRREVSNNLRNSLNKRENNEDGTGKLLDQLLNLLVKANIAHHLSSDMKSTAAPIEVFDFTPLTNQDSLMSESDLRRLFVDHIIPFIAQNDETEELNLKPVEKHAMPTFSNTKTQDEYSLRIKKEANQESGVRSRNEITGYNEPLKSQHLSISPKIHTRSTTRKLMTEEKVDDEKINSHLDPQTVTSPTMNDSAINSEIVKVPFYKYMKNKRFNSDILNLRHAVSNKVQLDLKPKMTNFSSENLKQKRDEIIDLKPVTPQTTFLHEDPGIYSESENLAYASNYANVPVVNFSDNSQSRTGYLNYEPFNNSSDTTVDDIKDPQVSVASYETGDIASTTEEIYPLEDVTYTNKVSNFNEKIPHLYITPINLLYDRNSPNQMLEMNNNSGTMDIPTKWRNMNYIPQKKILYRKSISSSSLNDDRNDAIVINIQIPESILRQLANEVVFNRRNNHHSKPPEIVSQVRFNNLQKNAPLFTNEDMILQSLQNKNQKLKTGGSMVIDKSKYDDNTDENYTKLKKVLRKKTVPSSEPATFGGKKENLSSYSPTTNSLNHEQNTVFKKSSQWENLKNFDEPRYKSTLTNSSNGKPRVLKEGLSGDNLSYGNGMNNEKILARNNIPQTRLVANVKLNNYVHVNPEDKFIANGQRENVSRKQVRLRHLHLRRKNEMDKSNKSYQMNRMPSHLHSRINNRKHKRRLRKSRIKHMIKIKHLGKLGIVRKSLTRTIAANNSNEHVTQSITTESSKINIQINPDMFLDWIVSSSNEVDKNPEYLKTDYKGKSLNISKLLSTENMSQSSTKVPQLVNSEDRHIDSYAKNIENKKLDIHELKNKSKPTPMKKFQLERSSNKSKKSNNKRPANKLLQKLEVPEVQALLFGNTSLDNFLYSFYKISRNATTHLPRVQRRNDYKLNTTKTHTANHLKINSHKNDSKKHDKLSHRNINDHHQNGSQVDSKKRSDKHKKYHKLAQDLKSVVWKIVRRHTNEEKKQKFMYRAALKKLPDVLRKHMHEIQ